jgi:hypothetical protein
MNDIKFTYAKELEESLKDILPIPTKLNIPDWYKKLDHEIKNRTVKGCMPFLDTLTTGYILKMHQDMYLKHNFINEETKKPDSYFAYAMGAQTDFLFENHINANSSRPEIHNIDQVGLECPYAKKNKELPIYKILNPYTIKTPPGYSCLFVPPLNNTDDRFSIIPGIVDTDLFNSEINFPIIINGDKYPNLETFIKRGTPFVQVIPFKRESWKMTIETSSVEERRNTRLDKIMRFLHNYKNNVWKKKQWR